jgi:bacillithiol biosynthesis cysteine-adding enzyme BshC
MKLHDTIAYDQTGSFSTLIKDYVNQAPNLTSLVAAAPNLQQVQNAINNKSFSPHQRKVLSAVLKDQYSHLPINNSVETAIEQLQKETTFTVCTAHQPNLFGGPLYCIYKVVTAIKLCQQYQAAYPQYQFVPVYYIGSEDHDLAELNHTYVHQHKLLWETEQTGSVGRMLATNLDTLIEQLNQLIGSETYGPELLSVLKTAYQAPHSMAYATAYLFHFLFGDHGLVVINPDDARLKELFIPIIQKEVQTQFSLEAIQTHKAIWEKEYESQAHPRAINLFYLQAGSRDRIIITPNGFETVNGSKTWTAQEMEAAIIENTSCFSPNVILRPLYQETILPNIAFVGGGSEVAYWLQQKVVFNAANISFPLIYLRNSALILNGNHLKKINQLQLSTSDLFQPLETLQKKYLQAHSTLTMDEEKAQLTSLIQSLKSKSLSLDKTLESAAEAVGVQLSKGLEQLEKKWTQTEKRKQEEQLKQLEQLKNKLFPNQSLQERHENFSAFYARNGKKWITELIYIFNPSEFVFTVIEEGTAYHNP